MVCNHLSCIQPALVPNLGVMLSEFLLFPGCHNLVNKGLWSVGICNCQKLEPGRNNTDSWFQYECDFIKWFYKFIGISRNLVNKAFFITDPVQRIYCDLPTMHCFQLDIFTLGSCGSLVTKSKLQQWDDFWQLRWLLSLKTHTTTYKMFKCPCFCFQMSEQYHTFVSCFKSLLVHMHTTSHLTIIRYNLACSAQNAPK